MGNHDNLHSLQGSQDSNVAWKRQKAFDHIISKTNAPRFSGRNTKDYAPWKAGIHREVEKFDPTPEEWLALLQARTGSVAAKIVHRGELLQHEKGAEAALVFVWKQLDRSFATKRKPSQDVVQELKNGPSVITSDVSSLWEFSTDCQMIVSFMDGTDRLKNS